MASPNFLQQLQLRGIFSGSPANTQFGGQTNRRPLFDTPEVDSNVPLNPPDTGLMSLRKKSTPAMDAYKGLLDNAPNRKDYESGIVGKLLALTAGGIEGGLSKSPGRGIAVGRDILDRPYNRALEDYSNKGGRLRELADLEYRGAGDQQKLEVEIAKDELARTKQFIDMIKTDSDLKLNDARAKELLNRITTAGRSLEKNEVDGKLYVVNKNDGTSIPIGQFAESAGQKRTNDFTFFKKREDVQQGNRRELENIRLKNDEYLTTFKKQIENRDVSATQDNAAFEGAYKEFLFNNPGMKDNLFTTDDKGDLVLKVTKVKNPDGSEVEQLANPQLYQMFVDGVNDLKQQKLSGSYTGLPNGTVDANRTPTAPAKTVKSDPAQEALRAQAIAFLKENKFDETDEDNIKEAIKQIQQVASQAGQDPFANMAEGYPAMYPQPIAASSFDNRVAPDNSAFANLPEAYPAQFNQPQGIARQAFPAPTGMFDTTPEAYPPMFGQPSRTQRELKRRGVTGNRFN